MLGKTPSSVPFESYRKALEEELRESFSSREGFLYNLLRYHLGWVDQRGMPEDGPLSPQFQSLLALACCEALAGDFHPALPAAAAVELVHNFTLVHGDVQAGRAQAEDRPSIWWVWGPAQAINAGDGLHALGRATIMRLDQRGVGPERVLRAVAALDQACLTLCEGQYLDLSFQDQLMVTSGDYFDMIERKAGALAGCAAGLGALAAGADDATCDRFRGLGTRLGMAWQVNRDVLDLWGERGDGLTTSNVLNKKKSLPLIHTLETAGLATKRELGNIYVKRVLEPRDVSRVIEILEEAEARRYARDQAAELVNQALSMVEDAQLPEAGRDGLRHFCQWTLEGSQQGS